MWAKDSEQTTSTQAETQDGTKTSSKDTATVTQLQMEIITLKKQLEEVSYICTYVSAIYVHALLLQTMRDTAEGERETTA